MINATQIRATFRPLHDWVVLKPIEEKERLRGGILLPSRVEDYGRCEVVAVGPGLRPCRDGVFYGPLVPTELKVGQFVFIQKFVEGELKFELNGEKVYLIRERHLNVTIDGVPNE